MPNPGGEFVVKITGNGSQLVSEFDRVKRSGTTAAKKIEGDFAAFQRRALGISGQIAAGIGIPIGISAGVALVAAEFRTITEKAISAERAVNQLNAVLKASGNAAGVTAGQLKEMAEQLQPEIGFDDDDIRQATTALLRFGAVSGEVFPDAIKAAADLARVQGTDLPSAMQKIARAISDPETGMRSLRNEGVKLSAQQIDIAARMKEVGDIAGSQKVVLDQITRSIGGSSEADTKGLLGATTRATIAWDNFQKALGKRVVGDHVAEIDATTAALNRLKDLLDDPSFKVGDLFAPERATNAAQRVIEALDGSRERRSAKGKISGLPPSEEETKAKIASIQKIFDDADERNYEKRKKTLQQEIGLISQQNAGALQQQHAVFDQLREQVTGEYQQDLTDAENFYKRLGEIAEKAANARVLQLGSERDANLLVVNEKIPNTNLPLFDEDTRAQAKARARTLESQIAATLIQKDRELLQIDNQRIEAARQLREQLTGIAAEVAAAEGRTVDAALLQFDNERRRQVSQLRAVSARGGTAGAEADEALRGIGFLRDQVELHAKINEQLRQRDVLTEKFDIQLERINLEQQTGSLTELEAINKRADAARAFIPVLEQQIAAYKELAQSLPKGAEQDEALARIERLRLEVDKLKASTEELAKKFNDVFVGAFSDALTDFATGAKSFKDILKDLEKSIVGGISRIASQNIAEALFKPENLGGIGGFFAKMFGGGSAGDAPGIAGGTAKDLLSGGSTLTLAGSTLTTAGGALTAASAQLMAASASLMAAGAASGAAGLASSFLPGLGSNIGGGFFNPFEGMGFFASGGTPPVGKVSVVGERGPELFVPREAGTIIPNDVLMAKRAAKNISITNNVTVAGNATSKTADQIAVEVGRATRRAMARNS